MDANPPPLPFPSDTRTPYTYTLECECELLRLPCLLTLLWRWLCRLALRRRLFLSASSPCIRASTAVKKKKTQFMMPRAKHALSMTHVLLTLTSKPVRCAEPKMPNDTSAEEPGVTAVQSALVMKR